MSLRQNPVRLREKEGVWSGVQAGQRCGGEQKSVNQGSSSFVSISSFPDFTSGFPDLIGSLTFLQVAAYEETKNVLENELDDKELEVDISVLLYILVLAIILI